MQEDRLIQAFQELDVDGSGFIEYKELELVCGQQDVTKVCSQDEIALILRQADRDGNGKIDYEEFAQVGAWPWVVGG